MRSGLLLLSIAACSFSCSPPYNTWYDGWCFHYKGYFYAANFTDSTKLCEADGAVLPIIRNKKDNDEMLINMNLQGPDDGTLNIWLNLHCDTVKKQFVWSDGSVANWTNFVEAYDCDEASRYQLAFSGLWVRKSQDDLLNQLVCMQHTRSSSICDDYTAISYGINEVDTCVKFYTDLEHWNQARSTCEQEGAKLASVPNQSVNKYFHRHAIGARFTHGLHIGLSDQNSTNNVYTWANSAPLGSYKNFAEGFPNSDEFGQCVAMKTNDRNGEWINVNCDDDHKGFVCEHETYIAPPSSQITECMDDHVYKDGDDIYSPGFPSMTVANISCTYNLMVEKGKEVKFEVMTFEINECCDSVDIGAELPLTGYILPGSMHGVAIEDPSFTFNFTSATNVRGFHFKMHVVDPPPGV